MKCCEFSQKFVIVDKAMTTQFMISDTLKGAEELLEWSKNLSKRDDLEIKVLKIRTCIVDLDSMQVNE